MNLRRMRIKTACSYIFYSLWPPNQSSILWREKSRSHWMGESWPGKAAASLWWQSQGRKLSNSSIAKFPPDQKQNKHSVWLRLKLASFKYYLGLLFFLQFCMLCPHAFTPLLRPCSLAWRNICALTRAALHFLMVSCASLSCLIGQ